MAHLFTLGGLSLDGHGIPEHLSSRPRRRAMVVLAVIARAGARGISRERLASLFWPDSDDERARQLLRQTLYDLRKDAGELLLGGNDLRLDSNVITSDLETFERHLAAGRLADAAGLYRGPFLHGVHVRGASEFERWADTERGILARRYYSAVTELARAAEREGRTEHALEWWSRATDAFPLDGAAATGLLAAQLAAGNRAAALRFAGAYRKLLRADLDVEPDASFLALHERAKVASVASDRGLSRTPVGSAPAFEAPPAIADDMVARAAASDSGSTHPTTGERVTARIPRHHIVLAAIAAACLTSLALFADTTPGRASHAASSRSVAVFPVRVLGDSARAYLAEGVSHLLTASLDGTEGITLLDAARVAREAHQSSDDPARVAAADAARLRADLYVVGAAIAAADGQVQIDATLIDRQQRTRAVATASTRGNERDLFALADEVARQLLDASGVASTGQRVSVSARTTTSLAAYKEFLEGEHRIRAGAYAQAAEAYQRAIALDSAFALAFYRLSEAADWIGRGDLMMDAAEHALTLSSRLAPHDRMLFEAMYAWRRGDFDRAEVGFRDVVRLYPNDAEAWFQLGEVRYHGGPLRGRPFRSAVEAFDRAFAVDSTRTEALVHLVRIAAAYGELARMDSAATLLMARQDPNASANTRRFTVLAHHDRGAIDHLVDSMRTLSEHQVWPVAAAAAQYAREPDGAARLLRLMLEPPHREPAQFAAASLLSQIELARGHGPESLAALAAVPNVPGRVWSIGKRALVYFAPGGPVASRETLLALRDSLARWTPQRSLSGWGQVELTYAMFDMSTPRFAQYPIGLLSLLLGDPAAAERAAGTLDTLTGSSDERETARSLATGIRAHIAFSRGDPVASLRLLEGIKPVVSLYHLGEASLFARERYLHARALEQLGRSGEAIPWYESLGQGYPSELGYAGAAQTSRARLVGSH